MKISLKYGLLTGLILSAWYLIYFQYLYKINVLSLIVELSVLGLGIYLAIREIRSKKFAGAISYKHAVLNGTLVAIYSALLVASFHYVFFAYGNQQYISYVIEQVEQQQQQGNIPEEEVGPWIDAQRNPATQAKGAFKGVFFMGLLLTVIFASILRKPSKPIEFKK